MKNILYHLNKIHDIRKAQGKRYKLKSILALVLIGYMSGCDSLAKIHLFGKRLKKANRLKLGFKVSMPSHPTITEVIKKVDPQEFEQVLSQIFTQQGYQHLTQIAIDGKSIRSTNESKQGLLHLVSAYAPEIGGVLLQAQSEPAGGEIKTAEKILSQLNIKGKVITADALYAQEVLCGKIVSLGANYIIKVKRNKKQIIEDIDKTFLFYQQNNLNIANYESVTKGHGRIDHRKIEVIEAKRKYFGGWGIDSIKQAACITRRVFNLKKQSEKVEKHYIISSLTADKGSADELLKFSVSHWSIENKLHRTRDTLFKEDVCNIICRRSHQVNAAMRNLAIFLLTRINKSLSVAIDCVNQHITLAFQLLFRRI